MTGRFTDMGYGERDMRGGSPRPSSAALFGTCLWVVSLIAAGAVLGAVILVVLARDEPIWFRPAVAVFGVVGSFATVGGLGAVRVPWLRWRLLGVATGALVLAALLTAIAL